MRSITRRTMLGGSAIAAAAATLAACSNGSGSSSSLVYYLNFKPEAEAALKTIAAKYKEAKGVDVKIVTAASGTYEQTLQTEVAKSDAPTIFNINGPVGLKTWQDYALDITDTPFVKDITDDSMTLKGEDGKVYGSPLATEGYGLIYNQAILDAYFAMPGAVVGSIDEVTSFDALKKLAEDMTAKKADLGIDGVFASTSLSPGEDWRWQTHLANYPVFYEFKDEGVTDSPELKLTYSDNYKQIFDLYLNNSTTDPAGAAAKTVTDSMSEFALGKAAFVQNGNWAWSQIAEVEGNTVTEDAIHFMPIYVGVEGEEKSGIALGTENYLAVNSQASEEAQKASIEFLTWLLTDAEGAKLLTDNSVVSMAPYSAFADLKPADPLGAEVVDYLGNDELYPINWVFQTFPSQDFKDQLGQHLSQYAAGAEDWNAVKEYFVSQWAAEKSA